jgi:hypothetical protein
MVHEDEADLLETGSRFLDQCAELISLLHDRNVEFGRDDVDGRCTVCGGLELFGYSDLGVE